MNTYLRHLLFIACSMVVAGFSSCTSSRIENAAAGGFSPFRSLSQEDKTFFVEVYQGELKLTPKKVSTQVVAGRNYRFICIDAAGEEHEVDIFEPLPNSGEVPRVTYVK